MNAHSANLHYAVSIYSINHLSMSLGLKLLLSAVNVVYHSRLSRRSMASDKYLVSECQPHLNVRVQGYT